MNSPAQSPSFLGGAPSSYIAANPGAALAAMAALVLLVVVLLYYVHKYKKAADAAKTASGFTPCGRSWDPAAIAEIQGLTAVGAYRAGEFDRRGDAARAAPYAYGAEGSTPAVSRATDARLFRNSGES